MDRYPYCEDFQTINWHHPRVNDHKIRMAIAQTGTGPWTLIALELVIEKFT